MKKCIKYNILLLALFGHQSSAINWNHQDQIGYNIQNSLSLTQQQTVQELKMGSESMNYAQLRALQNKAIQEQKMRLMKSDSGFSFNSNVESQQSLVQQRGKERKNEVVSFPQSKNHQKSMLKAKNMVKVPLVNILEDAEFAGKIYLGGPKSQPATLVFDTGSEYVTVTSSLCSENDRLLKEGKSEEEDKKEKQGKRRQALMQNQLNPKSTDNSFFQFRIDQIERGKKIDENQKGSCLTEAYDVESSKMAKRLAGSAKKLVYGSAELEGYFYKDRVCPVKNRDCFSLEFLAIYKSKGIHKDTDGIIGLSPMKKDTKKNTNILLMMKKKGLIDRAAISFSLSLEGESFALFGGVDPKQVVGGSKNIVYFDNFPNPLGTWALQGQGIYYGKKNNYELKKPTPAIIDTGTSQIALPHELFKHLTSIWHKESRGITCSDSDVFCHASTSCKKLESQLEPIGFELSGYVFWLPPSEYLFSGGQKKCIFKVHLNKLPGKNSNIIIIGDMLLKNFYSVYDYEQNQIGLGVDAHSKGVVGMYKSRKD